MIAVTGAYWAQKIRPIVFVKKSRFTQLDASYDIRGIESNPEGKSVCTTARITGTRCGEVKDGNANVTAEDIVFKNMVEVYMCGTADGDSGAPFYKRHLAFGILSGSKGCMVRVQGPESLKICSTSTLLPVNNDKNC